MANHIKTDRLTQIPTFANPRKLKLTDARRALIRPNGYTAKQLVFPMAVDANINEPVAVNLMPGMVRYSIDAAVEKAKELVSIGVGGVYLIGIPEKRDGNASDAWSDSGVIAETTRRIRDVVGNDLVIIGDSYFGYFTDHQIGGVLDSDQKIDNRATRDALRRIAVCWAHAGIDILCCSTMVDGRVAVVRDALETEGFDDIILMSSVKFNSAFFKAGTDFTATGASYSYDKSVYYIEPGNLDDAIRIAQADVEQGADMINVKPATPYQDVIRVLKDRFGLPMSAFSISGDYAMVEYGALNAGLSSAACSDELVASLRRAGADFMITYWAPLLAKSLGTPSA